MHWQRYTERLMNLMQYSQRLGREDERTS